MNPLFPKKKTHFTSIRRNKQRKANRSCITIFPYLEQEILRKKQMIVLFTQTAELRTRTWCMEMWVRDFIRAPYCESMLHSKEESRKAYITMQCYASLPS